MPQLDALRAFAVAAVMVHHFIPGLNDVLPLAAIGVRLFFVLSGFLITGILLEARQNGSPLTTNLRNFYARRTLRIFPLFYLTLAITYALGIPPVRETLGWHAAYLSNVYFFLRGDWHGSVSHFWSLAVEEQFYLAWPALVLLLRGPAVMRAVMACVVVGPLSRLGFIVIAGNPLGSVLPTSCLDTLGIGALLALRQGKAGRWWLPVGSLLFAACQVFRQAEVLGWAVVTFEDLGLALSCGWVVARAAEGKAGRLLSLRPLLYLGTILYGLYVFHNFVPAFLADIRIPFAVRPARFLLNCGVTVAAASLSWFLFERPLGLLKRHFTTRPRARSLPSPQQSDSLRS